MADVSCHECTKKCRESSFRRLVVTTCFGDPRSCRAPTTTSQSPRSQSLSGLWTWRSPGHRTRPERGPCGLADRASGPHDRDRPRGPRRSGDDRPAGDHFRLDRRPARAHRGTGLTGGHAPRAGGDHRSCRSMSSLRGLASTTRHTAGPAVDRRARRSQHPRDYTERQPARDAGGLAAGLAGGWLLRTGRTRRTVRRSRMAFVGARDIDPGEQAHLEESGIAFWSSQEVRERGVESVMRDALAVVSPDHQPFCLSFDIDVVDPVDAPGVDTAVPAGLRPAEAMECMARAGLHAPIVSMDLVELNPERDVDGRTAHIAAACISAAIEAMHADRS